MNEGPKMSASPSSASSSAREPRTWSIATWSSPLTIQVSLGLLLLSMWLLGKWPFATEGPIASERLWLLSSAFSAAVLSSLISIVLFRLDHPKARGVGISFLASSVVVIAGGAIYAHLLLQ